MFIFAGSVGTPKGKGSVTGNGEGIYTLYWDGKQDLRPVDVMKADNAGTICFSPDHQVLYAACETRNYTGLNGSGGGIAAYRIDWNTGKLQKLNDSISYGSRPSYVCVSESGNCLLAANHGSHSTVTCHYVKNEDGKYELKRGFDDSSVAVFHLQANGSIDTLTDLKVFEGHGYWCHGGGQSTSHLHSVNIRNDFVIAGNRGADRIEVMRLDEATGKLHILNRYHTHPGFAPRYSAFLPDRKIFYMVNENYPCISVYHYEEKSGELNELQTAGTMPAEYYECNPIPYFHKEEADQDERNTCGMADFTRSMPSDVHVRNDGKFVYVTNRSFQNGGTLATMRVNPNGTLQLIHTLSLDGGDPRGFHLSHDGKYLILGLCDQNLVQIYRLNRETGIPEKKMCETAVPSVSSFLWEPSGLESH